jgi:copper chaperone CopZ
MELGELAGVKEVDADLTTKNVKVVFEAPTTEMEIVERLKEINYPPAD